MAKYQDEDESKYKGKRDGEMKENLWHGTHENFSVFFLHSIPISSNVFQVYYRVSFYES